jgi:hypothetical protein
MKIEEEPASETSWFYILSGRWTKSKRHLVLIVSKMLGQTSGVSSSHQNKEKCSYKYMSGSEWFLSLIQRLHSTINTLTTQYFTYSWHTFTIHVPNLITVEFVLFIISHCSRQILKMSSTYINARMDTSDYRLSHPVKGPRAVASGLTGTTNALLKSCFILTCSWTH